MFSRILKAMRNYLLLKEKKKSFEGNKTQCTFFVFEQSIILVHHLFHALHSLAPSPRRKSREMIVCYALCSQTQFPSTKTMPKVSTMKDTYAIQKEKGGEKT